MSFLAPGWLAVGVAAAALVVALHLLARTRPHAAPLPTARFVPDRPGRATTRAVRPTDLLLLALRVLAVVLIGAALAGPVREPEQRGAARVVVLDGGRSAADARELRDSARALLRGGDVLVYAGATARQVPQPRDSLDRLPLGAPARTPISAALVVAARAVRALREHTDSVEVVVVSPFVSDQLDAATASVRALVDAPVRLARVAHRAPDVAASRGVVIGARPGDPVAAAAALLPAAHARGGWRLVRDTSLAPRLGDGLVILWPALDDTAGTAEGSGGLIAGSAVAVAPFVRPATLLPSGGVEVVARWADGAPAATEETTRGGCIRRVRAGIPSRGDVALRADVGRVVAALVGPCALASAGAPASDSLLAAAPAPIGQRAAREPSRRALAEGSATTPWLLGAALVLLLLELPLRRRSA